ncbi:unnamed protein product [Arabis nemorensis]|uniref:Reverse transcriptase zinc-binding domain-containing protein n=1 Tax=Arabis nemorensis TaxID=586526 RepID=A0A565BMU0_9BRAS|nr:unnamed protein product [Arabis nemorensis]
MEAPEYEYGVSCPYCFSKKSEEEKERARARQTQFEEWGVIGGLFLNLFDLRVLRFEAIWCSVFRRISPSERLFTNWQELLSWIRRSTHQGPSLLRRMVAQAAIYHIWRQRNNVYHNHNVLPARTIFKNLDREVRNIINSRRHRRHWNTLMHRWIR